VLAIGEGYSPEAVFDAPDKEPIDEMRFLVPVDLTIRAEPVLKTAFGVAEDMPHRLDLLHVVRPGQDAEQEEREVEAAKQRLENLVPKSIADRVRVHARVGEPVPTILQAAEDFSSLCIVMGAHGKGMLKRFLFGTTTLNILHGAKCPVWFVPEHATR